MSNYFDQLLDDLAERPDVPGDSYIRSCLLGYASKEEVEAMRKHASMVVGEVALFCVTLGVRSIEDLIVELRSAAGSSPKMSGSA